MFLNRLQLNVQLDYSENNANLAKNLRRVLKIILPQGSFNVWMKVRYTPIQLKTSL